MVHSRNKGMKFERDVRNFIAEQLDDEVINPAASGFSGADAVVGGFAIECKNVARNLMPEWWRQAKGQVQGNEIPVVVHKRAGTGAMADQWVTMDLDTFCRILDRHTP